MTTPAPVARRWLFGPVPDLLLGCGVGYAIVLAAQASTGSLLPSLLPAGLLVMATSIPHYGATLLRVYQLPEDRRRYAIFAVHGTLFLIALFAFSIHSSIVGSWVLTLYLTWSPWHYTGQNYGIFLMFLGRRGVAVTPLAKRLVYGSFVFSFVLTLLATHGFERAASYAPVTYDGTAFRLIPLGIPADLAGFLAIVVGLAYVACLVGAGALLLRAGRVRDLVPSLFIVLTQALWFSVPVMIKRFQLHQGSEVLADIYTAYGFLLVAAAHAIQYLWVTTYYAQTQNPGLSRMRYLGKTVLAGYAVWVLPGLVFAPRLFGSLPYDAGLALMVASLVNLHHFVLDGAIWKLRDGRVARMLLRGGGDEAAAAAPTQRVWLSRLVWSLGAGSLAVALLAGYEGDYGVRRALEKQDLDRLRTASKRLTWIGRDGPRLHLHMGRLYKQQGNDAAAEREFRRSVELYPSSAAWLALADVLRQKSEWVEASQAYEAALALKPDSANILYRGALVWLERDQPERARQWLERAVELQPEEKLIRLALDKARRRVEESR